MSSRPVSLLTKAVSASEQSVIASIRSVEPEFRLAVLNAITAARGRRGLPQRIARLVAAGRAEEAIAAAARTQAIAIANQYAAVYNLAGSEAADAASRILDVVADFNQVNERAVAHLQQERLRLIREFTDEQRRATRAALTEGTQAGLNPREQARQFRRSIGLTERQGRAVTNYRQALERAAEGDKTALARQLRDRRFDPTVRRSITSGEPLNRTQIDRMVERYTQRYHKYRAEVIARTESLRAVNSAAREGVEQAIEEGHVARADIRREWITAIDGRERDSHAMLNGEVRGQDEPFQGLDGNLLYPGDPGAPASETVQCRCTLAVRLA